MYSSEVQININCKYMVSFGGPRNDRYFDITFKTAIEFQFHVYKSYQKIAYDDKKQVKSCNYVDVATGEQLAFVSQRGIMFFTAIGPLFFNPETIGFDMLGCNPLK